MVGRVMPEVILDIGKGKGENESVCEQLLIKIGDERLIAIAS
jgi:hypothetical protein